MALHAVLAIIGTLLLNWSCIEGVYIPPGPKFPCPPSNDTIFPCVCESGSDVGIFVRCSAANLASISLGVNQLQKTVVDTLTFSNCRISRLYGPVFHALSIRKLVIQDTPLKWIEEDAFWGINRTLKEIYLTRTQLEEIPAPALKVLGNLSSLIIEDSNVKTVPPRSFATLGELETLVLANAKLGGFHPEAFHSMDKLKSLDLHGNELSDIPRNGFQGLRNLEKLDLSSNNFTKMAPTFFSDLTKLTSINVSKNSLTEFPRGLFARNTVLRTLNMSHNKLTRLDVNTFRGMRFLRRLYFSDNLISDIGRGTFGTISRVGTLDFARNQLTKVDFQMFNDLQLVEHIDLAENQITEILKLAFKDVYLVKINISHNAVSKIEPGAFQNCANMTVLDLSYNNLSTIPKTAMDWTTYPTELRLEFNHFTNLQHIPFDNMTGLKILNVSYNDLEVVPKKTFPKLYELHTIDLSHNRIREIDGSVFTNLFSIRSLNLSYNNMSNIGGSTIGSMPTLLELDMSYNNIKDVSRGAFTRLASIRSLFIHHNRLETVFTLPISLNELDISNNNVKKLPSNRIWPTMNSLLFLDMGYNLLESNLEAGSFLNLIVLQKLSLRGNNISQVPWEALADLPSLQYLYLDGNSLTALNRNAFGRMPVVFELHLQDNQISSVSDRAFEGLLQLLKLDLSNNKIAYIPPGAFKGLVSLRNLDLSRNVLERLDNKTHSLLEDCLSLEKVNVSRNRISFVTGKTFPESPWIPYRLSEIDLSYNTIPVLTKDLLAGTKKLKKLYLRGNSINELRHRVFPNMTTLEVLDLSENQLGILRDGELGLLPNLTSLDLSSNMLTHIPINEIVNCTKLKMINLANNSLPRFYDELIPHIENGTHVLLQDNPVACDCRLRRLNYWLSSQQSTGPWSDVHCASPSNLAGKALSSIPDDALPCPRSDINLKDTRYEITPDVMFKYSDWRDHGLSYSWYVKTRDDVGDFHVEIRPLTDSAHSLNVDDSVLVTKDVGYGLREDHIKGLEGGVAKYSICLRARTSEGELRPWKPNQCRTVDAPSRSINVQPSKGWSLLLGVVSFAMLQRYTFV